MSERESKAGGGEELDVAPRKPPRGDGKRSAKSRRDAPPPSKPISEIADEVISAVSTIVGDENIASRKYDLASNRVNFVFTTKTSQDWQPPNTIRSTILRNAGSLANPSFAYRYDLTPSTMSFTLDGVLNWLPKLVKQAEKQASGAGIGLLRSKSREPERDLEIDEAMQRELAKRGGRERLRSPHSEREDPSAIDSPPARRTGGGPRRLDFPDTPVSSDSLAVTLASVGVPDVTQEVKASVVGAVAIGVAQKTANWVNEGPRRLAQMPLGTGSGAAVATQAAVFKFYAEAELPEPAQMAPKKYYKQLLDRVTQYAQAQLLEEAQGEEWLRFTPEMKPVERRPRTFSVAPTSGPLRIIIDHPPRRQLPATVTDGASLWNYCHDHDINDAAAAIHAYDDRYVKGNDLDASVALAARLVVIRGLMTKRDITSESREILTRAMGISSDEWADLDDTAMLAAPGIRLLSRQPMLEDDREWTQDARDFAAAFRKACMAARQLAQSELAIDDLLEQEPTDDAKLNVERAMELQWVATLYRALENNHVSQAFRVRVGYMWRAKVDSLTRALFSQANAQVEQWIATLRALPESNFELPDFEPSNTVSPQMRLLLACVLIDSHYLNFSESKRKAWREMLQNSGQDLPMIRAFYYMSEVV